MSYKQFPFLHVVVRVTPLFLAGMCCSAPAHAQLNSQVLRPFLGLSESYDSNVLGLSGPDDALAETGTRSTSDTSRTTTAGLIFARPVGRQVLSANVSANRTRFDRLWQLDYNGSNVSADWAWRVGNNWDGNVGYTRALSLAPFTDFHALERNTNTISRRYVSGGWRFHPDWRVRGSVARYDIDYSLQAQSRSDRNEDQAELGIDYTTAAANTAGLQWRRANGRMPNQLIGPEGQRNEYRQDQVEFKTNWQFSGKTRLDFVGGYVARTHNDDADRDFHGYNGRATLFVSVTPSMLVSGAVWRETGIFDDLSTEYSTNRGVSLSARWLAYDKVTVEGVVRREHRDFTRSNQFAALPLYGDTLPMAQLSVTYLPIPRVSLQLAAFTANKTTNNGFGEYSRHGATLSTRYEF